jgi:RND family efflux transporter MFP subunit
MIFYASSAKTQSSEGQTYPIKGVTEPVHRAVLSSNVEGTVKSILFQEGDWVKNGAPIIKLDKHEQELKLSLQYNIWKSKAALDAAKVQEANLLELYNSSKRIFEKNRSVSKDELLKLKNRYDQSHFKRIELETKEKQEQIQYNLVKEQLAKRILYAPMKAIITNIFIHEGERCKANEKLVELVNPEICYFKCNIEERYAKNVVSGKKVLLKIQAGKSIIEKTGEIIFVSPVVDQASGLLKLKAQFNNHSLSIRPGVSGTIILNPEPTRLAKVQHIESHIAKDIIDKDDNKTIETRAIMNWLEKWRNAWIQKNIDTYTLCYEVTAEQGTIKGRENIREQKAQLWKRAMPTDIRFKDINVQKTGTYFQVKFLQIYSDSTGYQDTGKKTLLLLKNGKQWAIVKETWEEI